MSPTAKLGEVMSRPVEVAMADQKLAEIDALFATQSGLPVLDGEGRCIGVVSKKDKAKASNGVSAPMPILFPINTVLPLPAKKKPVLPLLAIATS
jgi:predicted transcriptional regulator